MSTNILRKLVEQFAPETVKKQITEIDKVASVEREARNERLERQRCLLRELDRETVRTAHLRPMATPICS